MIKAKIAWNFDDLFVIIANKNNFDESIYKMSVQSEIKFVRLEKIIFVFEKIVDEIMNWYCYFRLWRHDNVFFNMYRFVHWLIDNRTTTNVERNNNVTTVNNSLTLNIIYISFFWIDNVIFNEHVCFEIVY